ncbi:MAG: hypothetical protein MUF42_16855 [Cytophagaceae bacterium]|jgi:hypothetical protein|nr:hypothetical protein [Cytophagaceae bacterium]
MKLIMPFFLWGLFCSLGLRAQHGIAWHEIHRVWYINSAGYPSDDQSLDKMYFKLHHFKLDLTKHDRFVMTFRPDSVITGKYHLDKEGITITFTIENNKYTYYFLEVNKDVLAMQTEENKTWAYFLNLTSHF